MGNDNGVSSRNTRSAQKNVDDDNWWLQNQ